MQENEFEKRVQDKMEELSFIPSDVVWHKVEEELRPKKEKRRLLWMLPLFIIFIGIGLWKWTTYSHNNSKPYVAANESVKQPTKPDFSATKPDVVSKPNVADNKPKVAGKFNVASKSNVVSKPNMRRKPKIANRPGFQNKPNVFAAKQNVVTEQNNADKQDVVINKLNPANQSGVIHHEKKDIEKQQAVPGKNFLPQSLNNSKQEDNSTNLSSSNADGKELKNTEAAKITGEVINKDAAKAFPLTKPDSTVKEPNTKLTGDNAIDGKYKIPPSEKVKEDSSETKPAKIVTKQKKWEKVILVQMGWSNYGGSLFNNTVGALDISSSSMQTGSSISGSNYPNKITKGAAFAIGAGVKRVLNKRLKISLAIQYSFYSTNMRIGRAVPDSAPVFNMNRAPSGYYLNTMENNYTNKLHVAELPVSLEYRLLRKLPLQLSLGASYGYLLRTNALTFNNITNTYYYNRSNYVSNYLNIFSSLQYQFLHKGKVKVQTGPVILYNTIKLEKTSRIGVQHLYSYGLKTDIIF